MTQGNNVFDLEAAVRLLKRRDARIAALEAENARLRAVAEAAKRWAKSEPGNLAEFSITYDLCAAVDALEEGQGGD